MQKLHKRRIEAAISLWSEILRGRILTRKGAVECLKTLYYREKLEPIRGRTKIEIFDKELATVYVVGKYGLGLGDEYEEVFAKIFTTEYKCEKVYMMIKNGESARKALEEVFGNYNENTIFRVLRLVLTAVLLDFAPEEELILLLKAFEKDFPEYKHKFEGFKKFFVAFKLAEEIAAGKIKSRIEKEALKHALCLKLGAIRAAPPDSLIREIATKILGAEEFKVNDVLKPESIEAKLP